MKRKDWAKAVDFDNTRVIGRVPDTEILYRGYRRGNKCYISTGRLKIGPDTVICMQEFDPSEGYLGRKVIDSGETIRHIGKRRNNRTSLPMHPERKIGDLYQSA